MVLNGKIAIVTGGASGIGAAIVKAFAREGAQVVIADLNEDGGRQVCAQAGPKVSMVKVDVSDVTQIRQAVDRIAHDRNAIDVLVNCAGIVLKRDFLEMEPAEYTRVFDINVRGTLFFGQAVARKMIGRGGRIINIGSIAGMLGFPTRSAYGPSKAAVIQLTRAMAVELAPHNIYVNAIAPGPVETPLVAAAHDPAFRAKTVERVPLQRYGAPDDIASVAVFLASDASGFVLGQTITVDGGITASGMSMQS